MAKTVTEDEPDRTLSSNGVCMEIESETVTDDKEHDVTVLIARLLRGDNLDIEDTADDEQEHEAFRYEDNEDEGSGKVRSFDRSVAGSEIEIEIESTAEMKVKTEPDEVPSSSNTDVWTVYRGKPDDSSLHNESTVHKHLLPTMERAPIPMNRKRERSELELDHESESASESESVSETKQAPMGGEEEEKVSISDNVNATVSSVIADIPMPYTRALQLQRQKAWMEVYRRLVAYKHKYGNTRVPKNWKEDVALANWVKYQRLKYQRSSCIQSDRRQVDLLNAIGFEWQLLYPTDWMVMYGRLVAYKAKHGGSTRVPLRYKEDPQLASWVANQRKRCKVKQRIDLLNDIGFEWRVKKSMEEFWMEKYERLVSYNKRLVAYNLADENKQDDNHTLIPPIWKEDPQLGRWIVAQRKSCKKKNRRDLLNDIGFEWF